MAIWRKRRTGERSREAAHYGPNEPEYESHEARTMVADREVAEEEMLHTGSRYIVRSWARWLGMVVILAWMAVEALLGFRLGFQLAAANPANGFVNFIYDVTGPMVDPFVGIEAERDVNGGTLEPETAIAMAVYLALAIFVIAFFWTLAGLPLSSGDRERHVVTRTRHQQRAH